jgi:hypothetical protein
MLAHGPVRYYHAHIAFPKEEPTLLTDDPRDAVSQRCSLRLAFTDHVHADAFEYDEEGDRALRVSGILFELQPWHGDVGDSNGPGGEPRIIVPGEEIVKPKR